MHHQNDLRSAWKRLVSRMNAMHNKRVIRSALRRLRSRTNEDAFLIIEEKKTNKFVQFAKDNENNLIFDLPDQTLTLAEQARGRMLLRSYNIVYEEWEVLDKPDGKVVGTQKGFNKNLGKDLDAITEITYAVFTKIYLFVEPIKLSIIEN